MARILLVEDDPTLAGMIRRALEAGKHSIRVTASGEEGLRCVAAERFQVVLTDLIMGGIDGLEFIRQLRSSQPALPIILLTGFGSTDVAIKATKLGAFDYLTKPFLMEDLEKMLDQALMNSGADEEILSREMLPSTGAQIVGKSRGMQDVCKELGRLTGTNLNVLIRGETGTGKELVARTLHEYSERGKAAFVAVNCIAIPDTLLESELFGHERGAFTGATAQRPGKFEQAHQGTILLDEIGDISLGTQGKLLRLLQERTVQRLGSREEIQVDVRILAATHCDLQPMIQKKLFREDLYYRLAGSVITLPPLRERKEDIPDLVRAFVARYGRENGRSAKNISLPAVQFLQEQAWPGNVRELQNVVYRSLALSHGQTVTRDQVRATLASDSGPKPAELPLLNKEGVSRLLDRAQFDRRQSVYEDLIEIVERELYAQAVERSGGNQSQIAEWLGVSRPTVRQKLLQYRLT